VVLERRADGEPQPTRILDSERPLAGVRVLDLTRVIAGPVATRTLALFGADVLRIDSPQLREIEFQHLDTGADKQSAVLDLASDRDVLEELLTTADIVVSGYRPGALERFGLDAESLADRGIIPATLSAWGVEGPWSSRRGFDSIVQAASGIAWLSTKDGSAPGALPAQALDHSAGYLLAAGIMTSLRRRREDGTIWAVRTSLARMAVELLDLPRAARPDTDAADPSDPPFEATTVESETDAGVIRYAAPAAAYTGSPTEWLRAPVPWGSSPAAW
jgi:crotonobetainyl-CoA:carnitine CoA-transferase CaiB-like acyl-CoA transferase